MKKIVCLIPLLAFSILWGQNHDQVFVTENDLYGLIYLKKGRVVNNTFDINVGVEWVDKNLKKQDDNNSCLVIEKDCVQVYPAGIAQCVSFSETGKSYFANNQEMILRFKLLKQTNEKYITIKLPFSYAENMEDAADAATRSSFFYSHPKQLFLHYDLTTGEFVESIKEPELVVSFSGMTDPDNDGMIAAGETITLHYVVKNTTSKTLKDIKAVFHESNYIEGIEFANVYGMSELQPGKEYKLNITVKGLKDVQIKDADFQVIVGTDVEGSSFSLRHKVLEYEKLEVGMSYELSNIYFAHNSSILLSSSHEALNLLVKLMDDNKSLVIEIGGHTDNVGGYSTNLDLSLRRANAVSDYLLSKGISKSRVQVKGYSLSKPIATNDTEEGRAKNRRVEFTILKK